ncbi:MAG: hypothetical protein R3E91_03220 [Chlamydiales bacterium]
MESSSFLKNVPLDFYQIPLSKAPEHQVKMEKAILFSELDYLHVAKKIVQFIQEKNPPFKFSNDIPIENHSYQFINHFKEKEDTLLFFYRFYKEEIEQEQRNIGVEKPKLDTTKRIHYQVHVTVCQILGVVRQSSQEEVKSAIEDIHKEIIQKTLCGFAEITRNRQLEDSHKQNLKNMFDDFIKAYEVIEFELKCLPCWKDLSSEQQRELVIEKIMNLPSPKNSLRPFTSAQALIKCGYIVKDKNLVHDKPIMAEEIAKQCADAFGEKAGVIVKPVYSKNEIQYFMLQKKLLKTCVYLNSPSKNPISLEELNAVKAYENLLNRKIAQPVFDGNNHELTDEEKKAMEKNFSFR